MLARGRAAIAIRKSSVEASWLIKEFYEELRLNKDGAIKDIIDSKDEVSDILKSSSEILTKLREVETAVLGEGGAAGLKNELEELKVHIESQYSQFSQYHDELFEGNENYESLKDQVSSAKKSIYEDKDSISVLLDGVKSKVEALARFYDRVYGEIVDSEGTRVGGLAADIEIRKEQLDDFKEEQENRYHALNKEIESLLPGATSAGLATAYKDMKESFDTPIRNSGVLFYVSIGVLVCSSVVLSIDSISLGSGIEFKEIKGWDDILKSFVYKIPLYAPVLWLAIFASKRRSESQRLQQEYAHKEALAKSYHSYKLQIEELNSEDKALMRSFISKAIDAIAYNASETLDKKHGDKTPAHDIAGRVVNSVVERASVKENAK